MFRPPPVWSLYDMIEHFAIPFCEAYAKLANWIQTLHCQARADIAKQLSDRQLSEGYTYAVYNDALAPIITQIERLEFDRVLIDRAKLLGARLSIPQGRTWTAESVGDVLVDIRRSIGEELKKHKFAYLRSPNDQYFEQERLFGDEVYEKFPEARQDVKDAGNCFAGELYPATVFHLMRVAEYGLRNIAALVKVKLTDKGRPQPIEYATWDKVIAEIRNQITKARALSHGPKKNARLQFYSGAADTCAYIRDLWRNDVSHTRKTYNHTEALSVLTRVRDFMQSLARPLPR